MKTKQEALQVLRDRRDQLGELVISWPWGESCLDHRAIPRLVSYATYDEAVAIFGADNLISEDEWGDVTEWTEENIMAHMLGDLEFAFEKAYGQRGISAELMRNVMRMWMWVLDDEDLLDEDRAAYSGYGLSYLNLIKERYDG